MSNVTEVVFDMSFALGAKWSEVPEVFREKLMDELQGSRGLYDWVLEQATAFEGMWLALSEEDPRSEDYYGEVDTWFESAFAKLILDVVNEGANNV